MSRQASLRNWFTTIKFFENFNGGLPVNRITNEYISWESEMDCKCHQAVVVIPLRVKANRQAYCGVLSGRQNSSVRWVQPTHLGE